MRRLGLREYSIVAVLVALGVGLWLGWQFARVPIVSIGSLLEWLSGDSAEAHIAQFVRAINRGDQEAAIATWELPDWESHDGWSSLLSERREDVTSTLLKAGIESGYRILSREWWRTCCEPGVIMAPEGAGGARIRVQLMAADGSSLTYTFDVFVRGLTYWGAAMGHPRRYWILRDVYASDSEPLFWRQVSETDVHHLSWPASESSMEG